MKKIVALFTAMAFALTLGVAFAEEKVPATGEKAPATEKAPAKAKKAKKAKHVKKHKHEAASETAAPATK
jgi:hypothetical protein